MKTYRFEIWCDLFRAFYGCHKTFEEISPLIDGAIARGDFFTIRLL